MGRGIELIPSVHDGRPATDVAAEIRSITPESAVKLEQVAIQDPSCLMMELQQTIERFLAALLGVLAGAVNGDPNTSLSSSYGDGRSAYGEGFKLFLGGILITCDAI